MQQRDFDSFVDIIQVIAEQYGKRLSDGVIALYWQGLQDYDFAAVKEALGRHVRNTDSGMFMPKIADIRKMLEGTTQDSALQAWVKVDKAVKHVGPWRSVVFDDPLIHRVLSDMGGWISLGDKDKDEWPFIAKEFENRYRAYRSIGSNPEYPGVMIGLTEASNNKTGHQSEAPMLIGSAEVASKVLSLGSKLPIIEFTQASMHITNAIENVESSIENIKGAA